MKLTIEIGRQSENGSASLEGTVRFCKPTKSRTQIIFLTKIYTVEKDLYFCFKGRDAEGLMLALID